MSQFVRKIFFAAALLWSVAGHADYLVVNPGGKADAVNEVAPGAWFAPWQFIATGSAKEQLETLVIGVDGLPADRIAGVALFTARVKDSYAEADKYAESLLYFPEDYQRINATVKMENDKVVATFAKAMLPPKTGDGPNFLVGVRFANQLPSQSFKMTLETMTVAGKQLPLQPVTVSMKSVNKSANMELTVNKVRYPTGVDALHFTVNSDTRMDFAPVMSMEFPNLKLDGMKQGRTQMDTIAFCVYDSVWPAYSLLSDNLAATPKVTYTFSPAPYTWKGVKDDTGHDLLDGDCQRDNGTRGLNWHTGRQVDVVFDLKTSEQLGGVSLFMAKQPAAVVISVAAQADGPWQEAANTPLNLLPQGKFSAGSPLAQYNIFFKKLFPARFVRLSFTLNNGLLLSEVMLWGVRPGAPTHLPNRITVHGIDYRGGKTTVKRTLTTKEQ